MGARTGETIALRTEWTPWSAPQTHRRNDPPYLVTPMDASLLRHSIVLRMKLYKDVLYHLINTKNMHTKGLGEKFLRYVFIW